MSDIKAFLFDDDRGVSPVIGVILMVAITVILAAVIAAFVLGLGDSSEPAPSVSFDYDYDSSSDTLEVTVGSGDTFDAGQANVSVGGDSTPLTDLTTTDGGSTSIFGDGSTVGAGNSFTINSDRGASDVTSGDRVDITFRPEEGGEATILGTFTAPEN